VAFVEQERVQLETARLYRTAGVNPLAGNPLRDKVQCVNRLGDCDGTAAILRALCLSAWLYQEALNLDLTKP